MLEKENINLPRDSLSKDELMKLRTSARTNYNLNHVHTFFKLNSKIGFALSEIHSLLGISLNTLQKILLQLTSERKLYTITEGKRTYYFLNGSVIHATASTFFDLGSKEYSISIVLNDIKPIFLIKESEIDNMGVKETKGAIEIEGRYFDEFIAQLDNLRERLKEDANNILKEKVLLK
jgi:hypothetical protein